MQTATSPSASHSECPGSSPSPASCTTPSGSTSPTSLPRPTTSSTTPNGRCSARDHGGTSCTSTFRPRQRIVIATRTRATCCTSGSTTVCCARTTDPRSTCTAWGTTTRPGTRLQTAGVIGALELSEPGTKGVFPHEQTTPKAHSDRLQMLRSCRANLSAVWGLSLTPGLGALCELPGPPDARWTDDDGVHHRLYRVTRARCDRGHS